MLLFINGVANDINLIIQPHEQTNTINYTVQAILRYELFWILGHRLAKSWKIKT